MSVPTPQESFTVPRPPEVPPSRRFPLVAILAPIVASAVIYAVTRSPFTLVFALLGPVVAVASTADAALHRRAERRRETARFRSELAVARREVASVHEGERAALEREHPSALRLCALPARWQASDAKAPTGAVRVGLGDSPSRLAGRSRAGVGVHPELDELWTLAARMARAPVTVDASRGIGVVGPAVSASAVARGILLQLAARRSPDAARLVCPPESDWDWLGELPHPLERTGPSGSVTVLGAGSPIRVTVTPTRPSLPPDIGAVIEVAPDGTLLVDSAGEPARRCRGDFVSAEEALAGARGLLASARSAGIEGFTDAAIPERVRFADLRQDAGSRGLGATIGRDAHGPVAIDLASDGPHAVIGGTTGSGKSELLVTWMLAMAAERSPAEVTFLFVDFKGGAAFDPLLGLPHCVGLITDLDAEQSLRALVSLGAELRRRERMLAGLRLRSIDEPAELLPFPRLVVVVDEYAALLETHSGLHAVFADIAARGRSLGVHLILCTQRPAGVVRDSILANCALRVSLRVMAAADSTAVLGTDAASKLPSKPIGRALVSIAGEAPRMFQVARSGRGDGDDIAERWSGSPRPRAPWLPPLSAIVTRPAGGDELGADELGADELSADELSADDIPFGLADLPEEQSQRPARYRPREHGSLLVVGAAGAGKSGVLAAIAAAPTGIRVSRLPRALPQLWDALETARGTGADAERLLLLDDLDAIVATCDDNYRSALLDRVAELLRDGGADGIRLVITVQRITGALQSVVALCGSLLVLRMPSRQEHVLAGGVAGDYVEALPPGAGHWRGNRVQVYLEDAADDLAVPPLAETLDPATASVIVVSTRPEQFARELRRVAPRRRVVELGAARFGGVAGPGPGPGPGARAEPVGDAQPSPENGVPDILVSDPDGWQSQWTLLGALLRSSDLLLDGCSLAELRAITRSRDLPPPFPRGQRALWLRRVDGEVVRARLAEPAATEAEPASETATETTTETTSEPN